MTADPIAKFAIASAVYDRRYRLVRFVHGHLELET